MDRFKRFLRILFKSKLVSGAGVYVFGNVLQKAGAFLLIPLYTYYLSPEEFGITGVVQVASAVLTVVFALGISSAVQRYYYEYYRDEPQLRQYISSTFLFLNIVAGVASVGLFLGGQRIWAAIITEVPFVPYAQLMIGIAWSNILTQYVLNLYRAQQRAVRFIVTQTGRFLVTVAATIIFVVYLQMGAKGLLLGLLVGSSVTALVSSVLLLKECFSLQISWKFIRLSLVYGVPLIPHLLAQWIKTSMDRFILQRYTSLSEIGLYTLGYRLGLIMQVLVQSINMAYVPYFFQMLKSYPQPETAFRRIVAVYITVLATICIIAMMFARDVLYLLAPPAYYWAANIVPLILFGFLVNGYYFLAVNPLFYFEKTAWLPYLTGISAIVSVALNFLLIPRLGALGAAWSFVSSTMLSFVLVFIASRRVWKVELPYGRYILLNLLVFAVTLWVTYGMEPKLSLSLFTLKLFVGAGFLFLAYVLLLREYQDWFLARVRNFE